MPESGPSRQCRDLERPWRNHCVDRSLEDTWLEALNALGAFTLISICEGHTSERSNSPRSPHINLRLKAELVPLAAEVWDSLSAAVADHLARIFDAGSTSVTIELKLQVRLERGRSATRQDFTARIDARRQRVSSSMDPEISDWFLGALKSIEELDRFILADLCHGRGTACP